MGSKESIQVAADVQLDGDAINRALADAIIQSRLGPQIDAQVREYVKKFAHAYETKKAIEAAIRDEIKRIALDILRGREAEIREAIRAEFSETVIRDLTSRIVTAWLDSDR